MINLENPLMLIAQIYNLTLNARELARPMCFDLSRDARAAIACRVSFASYEFSALVRHCFKWIKMKTITWRLTLSARGPSFDVRFKRLKLSTALKKNSKIYWP